jgi:hypothetical protein
MRHSRSDRVDFDFDGCEKSFLRCRKSEKIQMDT